MGGVLGGVAILIAVAVIVVIVIMLRSGAKVYHSRYVCKQEHEPLCLLHQELIYPLFLVILLYGINPYKCSSLDILMMQCHS